MTMAKKARRKSAAKAKKTKRAPRAAKKTKSGTGRKVRTATRKSPARKAVARKARPRAKAKPEGIGAKLSKGLHFIVDTIEDTQKLRDKLEPPGTSETQ